MKKVHMSYYCHECKKTISSQEFYYSMNRYKKALCSTHQRSAGMSGTTKDLQDLVRARHNDELTRDIPQLKTVKDWIAADFETWDKVLKKEDDGSFTIKVSGDELKNRGLKRIKRKDKS
jgi:hypothetical protein